MTEATRYPVSFVLVTFLALVSFILPSFAQDAGGQSGVSYRPQFNYTLITGIAEGKMVYIGRGGNIDGIVNPTLEATEGSVVQLTLINGEGAEHDIAFPDFRAQSQIVVDSGASSIIVFQVGSAGSFTYYCVVAGHRAAGMEGLIRVTREIAREDPAGVSIVRNPTEMPPPIGIRAPVTLHYDIETVEFDATLMDGITYTYWTFDGKVPGPMLRVRVGDTVELTLKNNEDSYMIHSIDLHAVTGPGGGATLTQVEPGEEKVFTFKALIPGVYVYHCATPMVANHIAAGMYGLIVVEPEQGLDEVDHEFYVMQGEIYTEGDFAMRGFQEFSVERLLDEEPEYFVFNGAVGGLTTEYPMRVNVGDTVRIFFGVGGPNFTSAFHVIGEIFDKVYEGGQLRAPAVEGVQTISVPPGGATMVEFKVEVPGRLIMVDHALSRLERGLAGFIYVDGEPAPDIFREGPAD